MFNIYKMDTVDHVISGLSEMVSDLEEVQKYQLDEVSKQEEIRLSASISKTRAQVEADRADSVADKIRSLIE